MKSITFEFSGMSSLLQNNPSSMVRRPDGIDKKRIPTPEEECAAKAYRMASGQLYMRAIMFRSAAIDAVRGMKIGRSGASQLIGAALFVVQDILPIHDPETKAAIKEYEIDVQRCVVQGQGVMRARPRIDSWGCRASFEFDEDFLTPEIITDAFVRAGKICGVGDYRPRCPKGKGGPFGRFSTELISVG